MAGTGVYRENNDGAVKITHAPLNSYLKRFKLVDADYEDVAHFILSCPSYAHERWSLIKQAKKRRKPLTLETILSTQDMAPHLARYIGATHRFSKAGKQTTS